MVGVDSRSLYRRTHSLSHLAWSWVNGCLAPFYIHQMNPVTSRNGSAIHNHSTINTVLELSSLLLLKKHCNKRRNTRAQKQKYLPRRGKQSATDIEDSRRVRSA